MENETGDIVTDDVVEVVDEAVVDVKVDKVDDAVVEVKPEAPAKTLEEQVEFLKQTSRKHEANSRNNLKKFKETEELLNATLQEKEAFAAQLEALKSEAQTVTRKNVALKFGLSDLVASRLQGESLEELEADAQNWVTEFGEKVNKLNTVQGSLKNKLEQAPSQFQQAQTSKFGS